MREAVTECKVAIQSFLDESSPSAFQADEHMSTRSRKLTADTPICCEHNLCHSLFSAKTQRAQREVTSKNSPQKSISAQMNVHFALGSSSAHIRP